MRIVLRVSQHIFCYIRTQKLFGKWCCRKMLCCLFVKIVICITLPFFSSSTYVKRSFMVPCTGGLLEVFVPIMNLRLWGVNYRLILHKPFFSCLIFLICSVLIRFLQIGISENAVHFPANNLLFHKHVLQSSTIN